MTPERAYEIVKYAWRRYGEAMGYKLPKKGPDWHELTKEHIKLASKFARMSKHPGKIAFMKDIRREYRIDQQKRESVMFQADSLHTMRVLSGIRPTRPSLTEARSGITAHEREAQRQAAVEEGKNRGAGAPVKLKDQLKDAEKRARLHPKSGWKKHAAKIRAKLKGESTEFSESAGELITMKNVKAGQLGDSSWWITKVSPSKKQFKLVMRSTVDVGARFSGKGYTFRWDGLGYKRQGQYMTTSGRGVERSEAERMAEGIDEAKRPTFKKAGEAIMDYLKSQGWTIQTRNKNNWKPLKFPYAIDPHKEHRIWFKKQAVYLGGNYPGSSINDARSLHVDIRDVTPEQFFQYAKRWMK